MPIKKGESIVFSAAISSIKPSALKKLFDEEVAERSPRDNFFHCLVNAAHQFHIRTKNDDRYLLAGYPWFKCRARDTFIQEQDYFELVMKTAERGIREFMAGKPLTGLMTEIEQPDVLLWAIWAIQQYAKEASLEKCNEMYGKLVADIVKFIEANKHNNLELRENGLLYSEGKKKAVVLVISLSSTLCGIMLCALLLRCQNFLATMHRQTILISWLRR